MLSAVRAAGGAVKSPIPLLGTMAQLGMPLYLCPTPDGYKNTEDAWLSPDATADADQLCAALVGSGALLNYVPPSDTRAPQVGCRFHRARSAKPCRQRRSARGAAEPDRSPTTRAPRSPRRRPR